MATPIPVHFSDVLTAIQQYLLAYVNLNGLLLSDDRIFLCIDPDPPKTSGDFRIMLEPLNERQDPTSEGSGRVEFRALRNLRIVAQSRLGTDEQARDKDWLQGATPNNSTPTIGHLAFEDIIVDSMLLFQPQDNTGNVLTYKPCVYRGIDRPARTAQEKASGYGHSWIYFDVPYIRLLTNPLNIP